MVHPDDGKSAEEIKMKLLYKQKGGRITSRTRDDFLCWAIKKNARKKRMTEQIIHAKALATWADDGGQSPFQSLIGQAEKG